MYWLAAVLLATSAMDNGHPRLLTDRRAKQMGRGRSQKKKRLNARRRNIVQG